MTENYSPGVNSVVHYVEADFIKPIVTMPVHIMQHDNVIPIIAVKLLKDRAQYMIPENADVTLDVQTNKNGYHFSENAIGYQSDSKETIVYFEVTDAMSSCDGEFKAIVSVKISDTVVGTSYILIIIHKHPIDEVSIPANVTLNGNSFNAVTLLQDLLSRVEALEQERGE